jgi:hypothetical protein
VNRIVRRIFGSTGDKVAGGWRILHNVELHRYSRRDVLSSDAT